MRSWPSESELSILKAAASELRFLLKRGYGRNSAVTFVGNHHQLDRRKRHLLYRAVYPRPTALRRRSKKVRPVDIEGQTLVVDGYNCFITLESALKGQSVVLCDDGFVRDISGVFRRFKPTELTNKAWIFMERLFMQHRPGLIKIYLDKPYSNSGQFCSRIRMWLKDSGLEGVCLLSKSPEKTLGKEPGIKASADSVVIEGSDRVFDLAGHIVSRILRIKPIRL